MGRVKDTCRDINSHIPSHSHTEELYIRELLDRMNSEGKLYWSLDAWRACGKGGKNLTRLLRDGRLHAVRSDDEEHEGIILTIQKPKKD